jgi:uncharacterized protein
VSGDVVAIALGLLAGVLSAMFGVGGGVIFVPTLIFLGESTHAAVATSLLAMIPVVAMGSWRQTRYGMIRWRDAAVVGVASIPTAKLGEVLANSLSNAALRRGFALVLFATAVQLALRAWRSKPAAALDDDADVAAVAERST